MDDYTIDIALYRGRAALHRSAVASLDQAAQDAYRAARDQEILAQLCDEAVAGFEARRRHEELLRSGA